MMAILVLMIMGTRVTVMAIFDPDDHGDQDDHDDQGDHDDHDDQSEHDGNGGPDD